MLEIYLPNLYKHFSSMQITPEVYIMDWSPLPPFIYFLFNFIFNFFIFIILFIYLC